MENGAASARDPSGFLSEIIGNAVTVKLNSGVVYKGAPNPTTVFPRMLWRSRLKSTHGVLTGDTGELQSVDGYMNIALEQTKEIVQGKVRREYGDAFIRGNNGEFVTRERCLDLILMVS